jgi:hypothetical protein
MVRAAANLPESPSPMPAAAEVFKKWRRFLCEVI